MKQRSQIQIGLSVGRASSWTTKVHVTDFFSGGILRTTQTLLLTLLNARVRRIFKSLLIQPGSPWLLKEIMRAFPSAVFDSATVILWTLRSISRRIWRVSAWSLPKDVAADMEEEGEELTSLSFRFVPKSLESSPGELRVLARFLLSGDPKKNTKIWWHGSFSFWICPVHMAELIP